MTRTIFTALTVMLSLGSAGQAPASLEGWAERLQAFGKGLQQEEVFVHTDNTSYYLGDTLRFKAYLRLSDGRPSPLSRMLYVELWNPDGYLVERQKIEMQKGQGHGAVVLTDSLYGGHYELRAYTRWQLNWGRTEKAHTKVAEEWFYSKRMAKDYYRDYEKLYSRVFPVYDKPRQPGDYEEVMTTRPLQRYFRAGQAKPEAALGFFPEGGSLVAGSTCRVAFEANDAHTGEHLKGRLTVRDAAGQVVAEAESQSRGRGSFLLACKAGERYRAEWAWDGNTQEARLPEVEAAGCALQVRAEPEGLRLTLSARGAAAGEALGITASCHGMLKHFSELPAGEERSLHIPAAELPTGVIQVTVFNAEGRIYADRLVFHRGDDLSRNRIAFSGLKPEGYAPYAPIRFGVKGQPGASLSLAVRDSRYGGQTFDTGNILTEMLLASQIQGFVEQPDYFFEADDEVRREALDLLLLVQGWRRYGWREMTHPGAFALEQPYERTEILLGEVCRYTAESPENIYAEGGRQLLQAEGMDADAEGRKAEERRRQDEQEAKSAEPNEAMTEARNQQEEQEQKERFEGDLTHRGLTQRAGREVAVNRFYASEGNLKREVLVHAEFTQPGSQNGAVEGEVMTHSRGRFRIEAPRFYEACAFFLAASDSTRWKKGQPPVWTASGEDSRGEALFPEFYVKLDLVYPRFVKPYSFYQTRQPASRLAGHTGDPADRTVLMDEVTVGARSGGLRRFDVSKPALVLDAYEAFNAVCDAGLCPGYFIGSRRFVWDIARNYIGDMNLHRPYDVEMRRDTKDETAFLSQRNRQQYNLLGNLHKVYVYTDYAPRREGDRRFQQADQPRVTVDLRTFPNSGQRMVWLNRRTVLTGFAVCEDFYHPRYPTPPSGPPTDYRRTLYWNPNLQLDANGEAQVELYNNARTTQVALSAEGLTPEGQPLTGRYQSDY